MKEPINVSNYPMIHIKEFSITQHRNPIYSMGCKISVEEFSTTANGSFEVIDLDKLSNLISIRDSGFYLVPLRDDKGKPLRVIDEETYERLLILLVVEESPKKG